MPKILVQKFGGTSVDTDEHRRLAAGKIITAKKAGFTPVVVVSAIGRRGENYATDTLIDVLKGIDPVIPPSAREMDVMMACGEIISTAVMAATLQSMGYAAVAMTGGQAGIETDANFGSARISRINPSPILTYLDRGIIPVVCGFQGVVGDRSSTEYGAITTLGRGGSDTTAAALGGALQAEAVEIYTDVNGIKTADPDMVSDARTLEYCTYEEVAEMAHQGATVVHPRAAEIAMAYNIPMWVKSTFTDDPGTCIAGKDHHTDCFAPRITGVTHTGQVAFIRLEIKNEEHKPVVEQEVYRLMARGGVSIFFVSFSPQALSFAVPRNVYPIARDLLDGMVVPVGTDPSKLPMSYFYIFKFQEGLDLAYQNQRPLLRSLEGLVEVVDVPGNAHENGTIVSVIADRHRKVPGVMVGVHEALTTAGIPLLQVADSDMSISCLVPENDAAKAVKVLHARFSLGAENLFVKKDTE